MNPFAAYINTYHLSFLLLSLDLLCCQSTHTFFALAESFIRSVMWRIFTFGWWSTWMPIPCLSRSPTRSWSMIQQLSTSGLPQRKVRRLSATRVTSTLHATAGSLTRIERTTDPTLVYYTFFSQWILLQHNLSNVFYFHMYVAHIWNWWRINKGPRPVVGWHNSHKSPITPASRPLPPLWRRKVMFRDRQDRQGLTNRLTDWQNRVKMVSFGYLTVTTLTPCCGRKNVDWERKTTDKSQEKQRTARSNDLHYVSVCRWTTVVYSTNGTWTE